MSTKPCALQATGEFIYVLLVRGICTGHEGCDHHLGDGHLTLWPAGMKDRAVAPGRPNAEFQDGSRVLWNRSSPSRSSEFTHKPPVKILFHWEWQTKTNSTYFRMTMPKTHRDVVEEDWLSWAGMLWHQASKGYARTSILPSLSDLQPQHPRGACTLQ